LLADELLTTGAVVVVADRADMAAYGDEMVAASEEIGQPTKSRRKPCGKKLKSPVTFSTS